MQSKVRYSQGTFSALQKSIISVTFTLHCIVWCFLINAILTHIRESTEAFQQNMEDINKPRHGAPGFNNTFKINTNVALVLSATLFALVICISNCCTCCNISVGYIRVVGGEQDSRNVTNSSTKIPKYNTLHCVGSL